MTRKLVLRRPGQAALDLRSFWIEQIDYREADEAPDEVDEPTVQLSRPVLHREASNTDTYLMTLRMRVSQGEVRSIDLTMRGEFRIQVDDEGSKGTPEMLIYNGSAMLYGAARGIIETVTSLTGFGRLRVPAANIATLLRGK